MRHIFLLCVLVGSAFGMDVNVIYFCKDPREVIMRNTDTGAVATQFRMKRNDARTVTTPNFFTITAGKTEALFGHKDKKDLIYGVSTANGFDVPMRMIPYPKFIVPLGLSALVKMDKIEQLLGKARLLSSLHPIGLIVEKVANLMQALIESNADPEIVKPMLLPLKAERQSTHRENDSGDAPIFRLAIELAQSLERTMGRILEKEALRRGLTAHPCTVKQKAPFEELVSEDEDNFSSREDSVERTERGAWSTDDESEEDDYDEDRENVGVKKKGSSSRKGSWTCDECGKVFTTAGTLRVHKLTHLDDYSATHPYACNQCDKRFTQAGSLSVHRRTHMAKDDPRLLKFKNEWKCDICQRQFKQRCGLFVHKKSHLGKDNPNEAKQYDCRFCDNKFSTWQCRMRHERLHKGERPYKCQQCPRTFISKNQLNRHIVFHEKGTATVVRQGMEKEKNHKCTICPRRFSNAFELGAHMKRHAEDTVGISSDEKVAEQTKCMCKKCPRVYDIFWKLRRHEKVHGGLPFPCHYCDLEYRRAGPLGNHMLMEHGVETEFIGLKGTPRPFSCEHCPATFTNEFAMEKHGKVHAGPSSFKCSTCAEEFSTFTLLENHKRTAQDPLPYECKYCGRRWTALEELVEHKSRCYARFKKASEVASTPIEII